KLVVDLTHFGQKVPTIPVQRIMQIGALAPVRRQIDPRPSWCAVFTKAYARVAQEMPELRRAYIPLPWARLYEHSENIASIAVEREYRGENGVFFGHLHAPESMSLAQIDEVLRRFKSTPIDESPDFLWSLRITRLPLLLRRFAWWYVTQVRGFRKAIWLGTFGVSVYSSLGAESLHPISPLTSLLNYGVIHPSGEVCVRIVYDHRVMDGSTVARALERLERVLNEDILTELKTLAAKQTSAVA
ncbi:MAG TPA: hypothetical protein VHR72_12895, partial [Gemmataceae bacterium]|nr:hypothetical protein [Gemmataceae bacterium]